MGTKKDSLFSILLILLVFLNFFIFFELIKMKKLRSNDIPTSLKPDSLFRVDMDFPDVNLISIDGFVHSMQDMSNKISILYFTDLNRWDLPNIVYLDNLKEKYENQGVSLYFILSSEIQGNADYQRYCDIKSPIIECNDNLNCMLNCSNEDLLIVDRDLKIKIKIKGMNKRILYDYLEKLLYTANHHEENKVDVLSALRKLRATNISNNMNGNEPLIKSPENKKIYLCLFSSTCTICEENERIFLLKELVKKVDLKREEVIIAFGKSNKEDALKSYISKYEINNIKKVFLLESDRLDLRSYYALFSLDIDPRLIIIKNQETVFAEDRSNTNNINVDYLLNL